MKLHLLSDHRMCPEHLFSVFVLSMKSSLNFAFYCSFLEYSSSANPPTSLFISVLAIEPSIAKRRKIKEQASYQDTGGRQSD